jgi:hypothetical protein
VSASRSSLTSRVGIGLVAATLAMMVRSAARPIDDTDVWWNLRLGRDLLHRPWWGTPPSLSTFATADWAPTEPVPEVLGAKIEEWFGLPGLAWLYGLALVAVLLTTFLALRQIASTLPAALATLLVVLASTQSLTPRPQMVSLCLLPVVVVAWFRTSEDQRPRWWLIPLFWFWSCCHGFWFIGGVVGMLVALTMVLTRRVNGAVAIRLLVTAFASLGVVLLTPAGPRVFLAPFVVQDRSSYIIEWHRTDLLSPAALVALLLIAAAAAVGLSHWRYDAVRFVLLAVALFFTWYSSRTVAIGGLIAAVLLADGLEPLVNGDHRNTPAPDRGETIGLLAWAATCLLALALVVPRTTGSPAGVPTGLDPQLDALPSGTVLFNNYETGGWLAWRHPDLDHYIDPLADAYSVSHLQHYVLALHAQPGWNRILRSSRARVALLQQAVPLNRALQERGWVVAGATHGYVLLESPMGVSRSGSFERSRTDYKEPAHPGDLHANAKHADEHCQCPAMAP